MSNVIKSFAYYPLEDKKVVETPAAYAPFGSDQDAEDGLSVEMQNEINDATSLKNQILQDAEEFASEQVDQAMRECATIREQTELDIAQWWEAKRIEDEEIITTSKQQGYEAGFQQGLAQAGEEIRKEYSDMLAEACTILEQSYKLKQQIIQESEPFLIELSTSIAEKIIGRQLSLEPQWIIELIQKVLARRREKGIITLCVAPSQFAYIQDAREELLTSIDSQAELEIIPDSSVQDQGCVIRSSYGSIDAKIDTQLKEIKSALQQVATQSEES
ncbi:flagellar assembly protein FliH [Paenibacillus pectinilyticus]|uniref:Flagellar assembly protein FliH n=1 Tax=Paenibacillus pectinilyticus TaxID=512399 RepID=A0A1C1A0A4_9BACL|nr:FliH/SctL family protein [Paenibacillus pectinilyticus]OCT13817.1 flagellar assembly protein FliH [Paenibacillus pectinilyticus]